MGRFLNSDLPDTLHSANCHGTRATLCTQTQTYIRTCMWQEHASNKEGKLKVENAEYWILL